MAEPIVEEEERRGEEEKRATTVTMTEKNRREKRKERKKMKRKQIRIEMAEKEREEEEKRLNDPKELRRLEEMERAERERMERDQKEFEERERLWFEAMEKKRKEEEEEMERMKLLEVDEEEASGRELQVERDDENKEDDEWEYVEEGPAEIIWQGNEIIVRKKKVRVPKRNVDQLNRVEDADRPTSNPLPPQSEAFAEDQNSALVSAQQMLENVAQQVPNFGTEQDKAHCPFHLKTGACRFGERCSRVHFYPDKACTLLIRNMYNGPGLVWEQDEGLEHTDEEVERSYEEFYEDVHTEFLKYGEMINFKVCKNSSSHLRGNVYVHYKSLDSAVLAFHSINGRYFAGKQLRCEFVNVTRWKVAICGEYMKSRLKTCSRGMTCNFIHCFRNPGGDYEWADWDKPPPRYWVKKMAALFGYSVESAYDKEMRQEMIETDRHHTRRSRSRDIHTSGKSSDREDDVREDNSLQSRNNGRKRSKIHDEKTLEGKRNIHRHHSRSRSHHYSDRRWLKSETDSDLEEYRLQGRARKRSKQHIEVSERQTHYKGRKDRTQGADPYEEWSDGGRKGQSYDKHRSRDMDGEKHSSHWEEKSRHHNEASSPDKYGDDMSGAVNTGTPEEWSHKHKNKVSSHHRSMKRSGSKNIVSELPDDQSDRCRTFGTDSSDDQLESSIARHHSHARKRSRHGEPDLSGDERATDEKSHSRDCAVAKSHLKRNATDRRSRARIHSSRGSDEVNFPSDVKEPNDNHVSDHVDQHNSKHKSSSPNPQSVSIQGIDEQDRWQPESAETFQYSGRKSSSVDSYDSVGPDQFNRISESRNHNSEYFQNEGGRDAQLEPGNNGYERRKNTIDEDDKQYSRKSRSRVPSDFRKSKSRSSSRLRHKRRSRHMEKDSDCSEEEHEEQEKR